LRVFGGGLVRMMVVVAWWWMTFLRGLVELML
jgi:hypothetical protein